MGWGIRDGCFEGPSLNSCAWPPLPLPPVTTTQLTDEAPSQRPHLGAVTTSWTWNPDVSDHTRKGIESLVKNNSLKTPPTHLI